VIVVDTNVVAYLLIEGDRTPAARRAVIRDSEWTAPPLWRSELRNLLMGYLRAGSMSLEQAIGVMRLAERRVRDADLPLLDGAVLTLAFASGCSAYDCEFVAVAETADVALVTEDRRVLAAFPERAVSLSAFSGL
jgi:predicted nucleic acid-binding protein